MPREILIATGCIILWFVFIFAGFKGIGYFIKKDKN